MSVQLISYAVRLSDLPEPLQTDITTKLNDGKQVDVYVPPVADPSVSSSGAQGYFIPRSQHIVGSYAVAEVTVDVTPAGGAVSRRPFFPLLQANLLAPGLLRLAPAAVVPLAKAVGEADPNMCWLLDGPIALQQNEVLQAQVSLQLDTVAGSTYAVVAAESRLIVVAILADELVSPPAGEIFWIRTRLQANVTAFQWSAVGWNYNGGIPAGRYAVVGFTCQSDKCVSARLIFTGQSQRPGTIAVADRFSKTNETFYTGALGILGTFEAFAPPTFEFLCTADGAPAHFNLAVAIMKVA